MKKNSIVIGLWTNSARVYPNELSGIEIPSKISSFEKKIKSILTTKIARDAFNKSKEEMKEVKVSIGRYDCYGENIKDWTELSKLPEDFLSRCGLEDYLINVNLKIN